jgi:hypothetical protein
MELSINNLELEAHDLEELREHWQQVLSQTYSEVWLYRDTGEALAILINGDRGWLMFLRYDGDPGFHSINPDDDSPEDVVMDFFLSNGQCDEYPIRWTYPTETVLQAAEHFFVSGERAPFIHWVDS